MRESNLTSIQFLTGVNFQRMVLAALMIKNSRMGNKLACNIDN